MPKYIYNYDSVSGEFVSKVEARKSPLEKDVYLLPANATFTAPPKSKKNKTPVFDIESGDWSLVDDYRGEKVDVLDEKVVIKNLGETPDDFKPSKEQEKEHTANKITSYISDFRRKKEVGGITVNGIAIQTDLDSRTNLLGASQLGISINWKTPQGFVELTSEQITALAIAVGEHVQQCFNAEKAVLEAHQETPFTSVEDVEKAFNDAYNGS